MDKIELRESKRQTEQLTLQLLAALAAGNTALARWLGARIRQIALADGRDG